MSGRPNFHARARGHGQVYQAHRQHITGPHHHKHDHDHDQTGINGLFQGRGPGRLVIAVGVVIAGFGFVGWASIVFGMHAMGGAEGGGLESHGFAAVLGPTLPSGVQVGIVYFMSGALGGLVVKLGGSMARAGANGASMLGHLVAAVVIIGIVAVVTIAVLGGAPLGALQPHFSR